MAQQVEGHLGPARSATLWGHQALHPRMSLSIMETRTPAGRDPGFASVPGDV